MTMTMTMNKRKTMYVVEWCNLSFPYGDDYCEFDASQIGCREFPSKRKAVEFAVKAVRGLHKLNLYRVWNDENYSELDWDTAVTLFYDEKSKQVKSYPTDRSGIDKGQESATLFDSEDYLVNKWNIKSK